MRREHSLKDQLTLLFGGRALEKAIAFVSLIAFARLMSPADLALVPMFFIASSLAIMVAALGAMPVLMVELPRVAMSDARAGSALIRTVLSAYLGTSIVCIAILAIVPAADWISTKTGMSEAALWALAVGAFVQGGFTLLVQILSALSRFGAVVKANALIVTLRMVFVIAAHQSLGTNGVSLGLLASSLAGVAFVAWCVRDQLRPTNTRWGMKSFVKVSWPLYLEGFLMFTRRQGDQVVVGSLLGAEALTGYYLARRFSLLLKSVADTVNVGLAPRLSRLSLKSDAEFAVQWRRYLSQAMSFAVPIAFLSAIVAPAQIAIVGGEKYAFYALSASILCVSSVADMVNGPIINRAAFVLYSPRLRVLLTSAEAAVLLPLLALGASRLGATGAALAVVISGVCAGLFGILVLRRRLETGRLRGEVLEWLVAPIVAATMALAVGAAVRRLPIRLFELRELLAAGVGALTFGLAYANLLTARGFEVVRSTLGDSKMKFVIPILRAIRFRH